MNNVGLLIYDTYNINKSITKYIYILHMYIIVKYIYIYMCVSDIYIYTYHGQ